uniref:zinc finger CCCH domain-containing protein 3 n=1 Tax=Erigeron canadensis TaxID=72917 RepID=UPI001CB904C7|nr:zinc finger CCCH domain-containing protein 3 [Erigeron canadensis]
MPLGKYYCDYCDKQFQDTPFHRKRHIQGLHHQKAKALWYASLHQHPPSDHNHVTSFITNTNTGVCNRFIRTGSCPYGDSCKYLHPNQNLQNRNMQGFPVTNSMETQLVSFPGSQSVESSSLPGGMVLDRTGFMVGNLPPSLRPPPEGGYPPLPIVDWG